MANTQGLPVAQLVQNPPAMREAWVPSLGWEDPLEKRKATHSSILARRNSNNLRYADDTTLMAESEEELKNLLIKVKEESGKSLLKTQHSENKDHGIWPHQMAKILEF